MNDGEWVVSTVRRQREPQKMTFGRLMFSFGLIGFILGLNVGLFFIFQDAKDAPSVVQVTGVALEDASVMGDGRDVATVEYRYGEQVRKTGLEVESTVIAGDEVTVSVDRVSGEKTEPVVSTEGIVSTLIFLSFVGTVVGVLGALPFVDDFL